MKKGRWFSGTLLCAFLASLTCTMIYSGPVTAYEEESQPYLALNSNEVQKAKDLASSNVGLVGRWPFGPARAVALDENRKLAFLGSGSSVEILDVSNPSTPLRISYITTPSMIEGLFYSNNLLYVIEGIRELAGEGKQGLRIIDISNPSLPIKVGFYETLSHPEAVFVSGSYAYVAEGLAGIQIIDISNPSAPTVVGYYDTPGIAHRVFVSGSYAYVADNMEGLWIIDVSTPSSPKNVGHYTTGTYGIFVSGGYAYVRENDDLKILDVRVPSTPTIVGVYNVPDWLVTSEIFVSGSYVYVTYDDGGLSIIDVSTPSAPTQAGSYETSYTTRGVFVFDSCAYVADGSVGLRIIDVSIPSTPTQVGLYETLGPANGVFVSGKYAYVAGFSLGLSILDVSNPSTPSHVGFYHLPISMDDYTFYGMEIRIFVSGSYAYIVYYSQDNSGHYNSYMTIIDVSNPAFPVEVGFKLLDSSNTHWASDVFVSESYAYVAHADGLWIIDVSAPSAPTKVGEYTVPYQLYGINEVSVSGSYAYVTYEWGGMSIIDVSTPSAPTAVGFYGTPARVRDVFVSGSYAYVASHFGLSIIDVSAPSAPTYVGFHQTPSWAGRVFVAGSYAYVSEGAYVGRGSELWIVDVSNPSAPVEVGFYDIPRGIYDIVVADIYIYAAEGHYGMAIYSFNPSIPMVSIVATDPFAMENGNNATFGEFTITRTGDTSSDLVVQYTIDGTATNGTDYRTLPKTVIIPAGSSSIRLVVTSIDDRVYEDNETVHVALSANADYAVGSARSATITIVDDDQKPTVTITAKDFRAWETGDKGRFIIRRTGDTSRALVVRYTTGGTATNGKDYKKLAKKVTIPAGAASKHLIVAPLDDKVTEGNERVRVILSASAEYIIGSPRSARVTIADDE
jgi:hypothetical protein